MARSLVHFQVCIDHIIPVLNMLWLWILFVLSFATDIRQPPNFYRLCYHQFLNLYASIYGSPLADDEVMDERLWCLNW